MYIGREIAEHQDWYLGSTATSSVLSNPSAWIGIAILLYLLVFCGRTTRLVVLGMLAVPV